METTSGVWAKILGVFEAISFWGILAATALLPIAFIPSYYFPSQNFKAGMFAIAAAFCLFTLLLRFLVTGRLAVQKSWAVWAFVLLAIAGVVSSFFSGAFFPSFIGDGAELGTSAFMLAFAAIILCVPLFFAEKKKIFYFYFAFLFSFFVLAIFHVLRLAAGSNFLSFGMLTDPASSIVGNWNDIGIIAGVAALFSVIGFESKAFGGILRGILYAVFPLSLILLIVVNFSIGWVILAVLSLALSAYFFFSGTLPQVDGQPKPARSLPLAGLILFVVSIVFIFAGGIIGAKVSSTFHIFQLEAHPLWSTTIGIAKPVVKAKPVLGVGPNRFSYVWQLLKPAGVNSSPFWSTIFLFGVGIVPTSVITMGLVGFLLYVLFFAFYLWNGWKALRSLRGKTELSRFVILTSFFGSLFLWAAAIFYVPGVAAFSLAALWTAIFFAALESEGLLARTSVNLKGSKAGRILSSIVIAILMIGTACFAYMYAAKTLAAAYLQRASVAEGAGNNPVLALSYADKALAYSKTPLVYRSIVSIDLDSLNRIIATASDPSTQPTDALKTQFTSALSSTLDAGKAAVTGDSVDFRNWVSLGSIYETLVPIAFPNAYQNANSAYLRAQALSPVNPEMYLDLARLEYENGTTTPAKMYLSKALQLKPDYVAGMFLLSQIQVAEKNVPAAIKTLQAAASVNPNDQTVLYQLGALSYSTGDYKTAAAALQAAVTVNPSFSNALYLLGLSYDKLGRASDALAAFQAVLRLNPNSTVIQGIIANLQAGKAIDFTEPAPAATSTKATTLKPAATTKKK